jgi:hypothetical protein
MRRAVKVDSNQPDIIKALRQVGARGIAIKVPLAPTLGLR